MVLPKAEMSPPANSKAKLRWRKTANIVSAFLSDEVRSTGRRVLVSARFPSGGWMSRLWTLSSVGLKSLAWALAQGSVRGRGGGESVRLGGDQVLQARLESR